MKTLVDQLKDMIESAEKASQFITKVYNSIIGHPAMTMSEEQELFLTIVERIVDEYMLLPRDADGMPIKLGDEVYILGDTRKFIVVRFNIEANNTLVSLNFKDGGSKSELLKWPSEISHKEPDTLERIKADAIKEDDEYWGCADLTTCRNCPALVNGERPDERYEVEGNCQNAMVLDLLARQRKVLERMAEHSTV